MNTSPTQLTIDIVPRCCGLGTMPGTHCVTSDVSLYGSPVSYWSTRCRRIIVQDFSSA